MWLYSGTIDNVDAGNRPLDRCESHRDLRVLVPSVRLGRRLHSAIDVLGPLSSSPKVTMIILM